MPGNFDAIPRPEYIPIIYHGVAHKLEKGLFWDSEREVYILKDKLKEIEIIDCKDNVKQLTF